VSRADLRACRRLLESSRRIVALTGAGISAECGIPTFRGPGGWWRNRSPQELATPEAFASDPVTVWEWYLFRREMILDAEPGPAHRGLAELERLKPEFTLITQNVDGLHERAGSRRLIELHGNLHRARCTGSCGTVPLSEVSVRELPPRCKCGRPLRPDVVWFGEALPEDAFSEAARLSRAAQVMLVIGTSGVVYPAAGLARLAADAGGTVVEVNPEPTPLSSLCRFAFHERASRIIPFLLPKV